MQLESKIIAGLSKLTGELAGTYTPLHTLNQEQRDTLVEEHYLFADADDRLNIKNILIKISIFVEDFQYSLFFKDI